MGDTMGKNQTVDLILYFVRRHRGRSLLLVILLCLSGLAEGVGILALLPLLEMAVETDSVQQPSALTAAVHTVLGAVGLQPQLGVLLSLIVLGMVLKAALYLLAMKQVGYTVARVVTELRLELIRALLQTRWTYFVSQPAGRFANSISTEAAKSASAYRSATALIAGGVQVAIYTILALLVSWQIAIFAVIGGLVIVVALGRLIAMSRDAGASQTHLMKSLVARLIDALQGIKPIKAMGQETSVQPLLESEARELNEAQEQTVLATETLKAAQEPILVVLLAAALYIALSFGDLSFGTVLVMAFLFYRLAGRISLLQIEYQTIASHESSFWSLRASIDQALRERETYRGTRPPPDLVDSVSLKNVTFGYTESPLFTNFSMVVPAGRFVALVGTSGAGKTSIADLIAGLHRPSEGEVLIDGVPLGEIDLHAWREQIGYVPQEMFLFHDTVLQNITLGCASVSVEDVEWALRSAGAWDFVQQLPDGLNTLMGERGSRLSGGQRQRIAIARALARRPKLLILDEVTTALDPATEEAICGVLRTLSGRVTILSISHQPAMTEAADLVYHLEAGRALSIARPGAAEMEYAV